MNYYQNLQEQEHNDFNYTSEADWDKEDARIIGEQNTNYPWVCSGRDVWYPNPYWGKYDQSGNPLRKEYPFANVPHPESYDGEES